MCVEHEATTKTQPTNGSRIRCHDDDLGFETIIASKSTTPAIQSRPTSMPSEARHALTYPCTYTATAIGSAAGEARPVCTPRRVHAEHIRRQHTVGA